MMGVVDVYTDGACSQLGGTGHGPGGWAAIILADENEQISGGTYDTTNQRMELTAVIEALNHIPPSEHVRIHSDSQYIIGAMTEGWIQRWIKRGWKNSAKKAVANVDLWEALLKAESRHKVVEWIKVKGHAGDAINNQVDALAVAETNGAEKAPPSAAL